MHDAGLKFALKPQFYVDLLKLEVIWGFQENTLGLKGQKRS